MRTLAVIACILLGALCASRAQTTQTQAPTQCVFCTDGVGVLRPNFTASAPNGCGTGSTASIVPEFGFNDCCNAHDNCYSTCTQKEICDRRFYACMRGVCDGENLVSAYACNQVADCYAAAVDTDVACNIWQNYQQNQCVCTPGATAAPVDTSNLPQLPSSSALTNLCLSLDTSAAAAGLAPLVVAAATLAVIAMLV